MEKHGIHGKIMEKMSENKHRCWLGICHNTIYTKLPAPGPCLTCWESKQVPYRIRSQSLQTSYCGITWYNQKNIKKHQNTTCLGMFGLSTNVYLLLKIAAVDVHQKKKTSGIKPLSCCGHLFAQLFPTVLEVSSLLPSPYSHWIPRVFFPLTSPLFQGSLAICWKICSACCHSPAFSQALMVALKLMLLPSTLDRCSVWNNPSAWRQKSTW